MITEAIQIPEAPALPGLVFRHFRGEADFPGMVAAINASETADKMERVATVEEIANSYAHLTNCDPYQDLLVVEISGEIAGYSRIEWQQNAAGERLYWRGMFLKPEWRRRGLGRAVLRWIEARSREIDSAHPVDGARFFQTFASDAAPGAEALLRQSGYTAVRHFYRMVRPTLDDIADFPLPAGLEVRPVTPEHYRAIWQADVEAFRDHWG